nr:immunoglobulin heavy chain junction region [Mus musculus]MBK4186924.1 immunoglobulin heavy chain junction region [Mus musculus]MBK4186925.1 immunoglobulin heavy chain junction region [Mus musculus]MBK4186926.1 immunoglobulin heavy chain junction region [Mus musculus]MBK4186961.1 immunoglobulin heavy chain junction region [Mus musculus]
CVRDHHSYGPYWYFDVW